MSPLVSDAINAVRINVIETCVINGISLLVSSAINVIRINIMEICVINGGRHHNLCNIKFGINPDGWINLEVLLVSFWFSWTVGLGSDPYHLQSCPRLARLVLTNNFRGGEVMPAEGIQGFDKLELLVIANCALKGSIPPWMANLSQLRVLEVSCNYLSGTIPPWLGKLDNLFYLDMSNNSLSGQLPYRLTQMKSLISFNKSLEFDSLGNFPLIIRRNFSRKGLQYNQVSNVPPSLILSNNRLVGQILSGLENLAGVHVLDLSWNSLSGSIPKQLSGMTSLEYLDLSHNNLTGSIPDSLTNLTFLSKFNVTFNNLVGAVPTGGQFSTFSSSDFEGNPGLCGFQLSPCQPEGVLSSGSRAHGKEATISMAIGIGIGSGAVIVLGAVYGLIQRSHSRKQTEQRR